MNRYASDTTIAFCCVLSSILVLLRLAVCRLGEVNWKLSDPRPSSNKKEKFAVEFDVSRYAWTRLVTANINGQTA